MRATTLFTTVLLFYMAEAQQLNLPQEFLRLRRSPHNPINVSQTEFETKMKEYHRLTRGTEQQRKYEPIAPMETHPQADGVKLKFSSPHFKRAEGITLKVLVSSAKQVNVYQTMENGQEVEVKSTELQNVPLWVDAHLEPSTEINIRISCGSGCKIQYPTANVQYEIVKAGRAWEAEGTGLCSPNAQPQDDCCLSKYKIKFSDLEKEGLEPIYAPIYYDASYCGNYYCSGHPPHYYKTIKNHVLYNPGDPPESDCSVTVYGSLRVITVHPENPEVLVIQVWKEGEAKQCGCV